MLENYQDFFFLVPLTASVILPVIISIATLALGVFMIGMYYKLKKADVFKDHLPEEPRFLDDTKKVGSNNATMVGEARGYRVSRVNVFKAISWKKCGSWMIHNASGKVQ